jgi:signal transduction histidine kinase
MRLRLFISFVIVVLISVLSVVVLLRGSAANEVRAFMLHGAVVESEQLVSDIAEYYQQTGTLIGAADALNLPNRGQARGRGNLGVGMGINQNLVLADQNGDILYSSTPIDDVASLSALQLQNALPIQQGGKNVGYILIEGSSSYSSNDEAFLLNRINQTALIAGVIAIAISLLVALFLAHRLLLPVRDLTNGSEQLAAGDLSYRVPIRGNDELAALGKTFNLMADSLQNAEENRQVMTADIAHELRNPLAVQRATLEALQDGIYEPTPDRLGLILEQNQMLTRLVNDLRTLALADAGRLELDKVPTDIYDLLQRVEGKFSVQAAEHGQGITISNDIQGTTSLVINIDPIRVEQIINNLISNALRYSPENGQIQLRLSTINAQLIIDVIDQGPGIPDDALPHIFERFYRADKSRSRQEGGTGLGLAIARQLAEAHGGSLNAVNLPAGGSKLTLSLPILDS